MTSSQAPSEDEMTSSKENEMRESIKEEFEEEEEDVFCICRKPAGDRFMICCDACNEWYHGDCIEITRTEGKTIDIYFCQQCISKDPDLKTVYFEKRRRMKNDANDVDANAGPQRCTNCINCLMMPDCGDCSRCKWKNGRCLLVKCLLEASIVDEEKKEKPKKDHRKIRTPSPLPSFLPISPESSDCCEDKVMPVLCPTPLTGRAAGGGGIVRSMKKPRPRKIKKDKISQEDKSAKKVENEKAPSLDAALVERLDQGREAYAEYSEWMEKEKKVCAPSVEHVKCLGSDCVNEALPNTKYCSDECGMKVAKKMLKMYLPRGLDYNRRADAIAASRAKEEEARKARQLERLRKEKEELDRWHSTTVNYVNALKQFSPNYDEEWSELDRKEDEIMVSCIICAGEFGHRGISRHMMSCYAKAEKKFTFGANNKVEDTSHDLFCERFNPWTETYCKRIKVLCHLHYKGEIEEGLEVCAYPKVWIVERVTSLKQKFTSIEYMVSQGFCDKSRKLCKMHRGWITRTLGEIDSLRVASIQSIESLDGKQNPKPGEGNE